MAPRRNSQKWLEARKAEACTKLARLREERSYLSFASIESFLRDNDGSFSLEDIGTTEEEFEKLRVEARKTAARNSLTQLRENSPRSDLKWVMLWIKGGDFILADIGTSEDELKNLQVEARKAEARQYLTKLREKEGTYLAHQIRDLAKRERFSLADIGTNEEELERLLVENHKCHAHHVLTRLREGKSSFYRWFDLRDAVKAAGFTLADMGVSEEEIEALGLQPNRRKVKETLEVLRRRGFVYEDDLSSIQYTASLNGFSLTEIGMSEEELRQLKLAGYRRSAKYTLEDIRVHLENATWRFRQAEAKATKGGFSLADIGMSEEEIAFLKQWRAPSEDPA